MKKETLTKAADRIQITEFSELEVASVEYTFRAVWHEMFSRLDIQFDIDTAGEDAITLALQDTFDELNMIGASELNMLKRHFDTVPEADAGRRSSRNTGGYFDARPDFAFRRKVTPRGESRIDGCFFVEAKLIEKGKTMGLYCSSGLIRFVDGKYAKCTSQAMMLGYHRDSKQSLPKSLEQYLKRPGNRKKYRLESGPDAFSTPTSIPNFNSSMYSTIHNRGWKFPNSSQSPGKIEVYHLWLRVGEN